MPLKNELAQTRALLLRLPEGWRTLDSISGMGGSKACPLPSAALTATKDGCVLQIFLAVQLLETQKINAQLLGTPAELKAAEKIRLLRRETKEGMTIKLMMDRPNGDIRSFDFSMGVLTALFTVEHSSPRPEACGIISSIYQSFDYRTFARLGKSLTTR